MKCPVSCVTYDPKFLPTTQCHVGWYFLSNSFLMYAAMSFSISYLSNACFVKRERERERHQRLNIFESKTKSHKNQVPLTTFVKERFWREKTNGDSRMRKKKNHYTYNFGAIYRVLYDFLLVMIEIDRERFHSVFFSCIHSSRYTRRPFVFPSVGLTFKILCTRSLPLSCPRT